MSSEDHDEDGLRLAGYDLILLGTGLTMSIVSAAASRVGKTVLHLDKNEFYGGKLYGSYNSLSSFIEYTREQRNLDRDIVDFYVHPSIDKGKSTANIKLDQFHPACNGYLMEKIESEHSGSESSSSRHPCFFRYSFQSSNIIDPSFRDRGFNVECCSKLIFSDENTIDFLIRSGISEYMEFCCLDSLQYLSPTNRELLRVPTSKSDVFASNFLTAMEKRSIMRLQSFAADYAIMKQEQQQQQSLIVLANERSLSTGGSLVRPQNKAPDTALSAALTSSVCFSSFLRKYCLLSPQLLAIVIHCICLRNTPVEESALPYDPVQGISELWQHFSALGRFNDGGETQATSKTAFLLPLYGTSDLVQAFCRVSAVWGGVFILRRNIAKVLLACSSKDNEENEGNGKEDKREFSLSEMSSTYLPENQLVCGVRDSSGKSIRCKNLVADSSYFDDVGIGKRRFTMRGLVLCCVNTPHHSPLPMRAPNLLVIPPLATYKDIAGEQHGIRSLDNWAAVQVLQTDYTTRACPVDSGFTFLHIRSELQNCSKEKAGTEAKNLFDGTIRLLQGLGPDTEKVRFRVLMRLLELDSLSEVNTFPCGIISVSESDSCVHVEQSIKNAKAIFHSLFPSLEFFPEKVSISESKDETADSRNVVEEAACSLEEDEEMRFFEETLVQVKSSKT